MHVKHKLIKPNTMQSRVYQETILGQAIDKNLLCVLPTGLGKTPIAVLLAAHRLEKYPDSKILVLAPTKPLTNQNCNMFKKFLEINQEEFQVITGIIKPKEREELYKKKKLIFATPQTIANDYKAGRISLKNFSLLVTDEAHHSIGKYSYPYVTKRYLKEAENPRVLGLTASPGATHEKIKEICNSLGIQAVEIRTERDADVVPYVKEKEIEWVYVDLPESFKKIKQLLEEIYRKKVQGLIKWRLIHKKRASKKQLLELQKSLIKEVGRGNRKAFAPMMLVVQAIKLEHALGLLETQGLNVLNKYWKKLMAETSKVTQRLIKNRNVSQAIFLTNDLLKSDCRHPKMGKLCSIVERQLNEKQDSKIIIFANFRESVKEIVNVLKRIDNVKPIEFVGQRMGITQKEQIKRLEEFRSGSYNVLVCTSIGEEGLDIPSMDIAIFYEPVPSEIRSIQRRGRVGRQKIGKIVVLIARETRDEAYKWSAYYKEKKMRKTLYGLKKEFKEEKNKKIQENKQKNLKEF